jgi:hypothetical protein
MAAGRRDSRTGWTSSPISSIGGTPGETGLVAGCPVFLRRRRLYFGEKGREINTIAAFSSEFSEMHLTITRLAENADQNLRTQTDFISHPSLQLEKQLPASAKDGAPGHFPGRQ